MPYRLGRARSHRGCRAAKEFLLAIHASFRRRADVQASTVKEDQCAVPSPDSRTHNLGTRQRGVTQCSKVSSHRKGHKRNGTWPGGMVVIHRFCGLLDRTAPKEETVNRAIYKPTRRLAPALTVVYRVMQIVLLLISCERPNRTRSNTTRRGGASGRPLAESRSEISTASGPHVKSVQFVATTRAVPIAEDVMKHRCT